MSTKKRKKKKQNPLPLFFVLVLVAFLGIAFYLFQEPVVLLRKDLHFSVGEALCVSDLVQEIKNGTLTNGSEFVESKQAGTVSVLLRIRNRMGQVHEKTVTVTLSDHSLPTIEGPEEIKVTQGTQIDLSQKFIAKDDSGATCAVSVSGTYSLLEAGSYPLKAYALDRAGNRAEKEFTLTVLPLPYNLQTGALSDGTYQTEKGFELKVINGITYVDGILIANKSYSLPRTYNPGGLTSETAHALSNMQDAAADEGITLNLASGFRSWDRQNTLFQNYAARDGVKKAETYSARPGHSEHQSGMGIDLVTASSEQINNPTITKKLDWLNQNAYRYGFILRYPKGKEAETGIVFEPWHYRYVGVELAKKLYNDGNWITLEEYFGLESVYRGY